MSALCPTCGPHILALRKEAERYRLRAQSAQAQLDTLRAVQSERDRRPVLRLRFDAERST